MLSGPRCIDQTVKSKSLHVHNDEADQANSLLHEASIGLPLEHPEGRQSDMFAASMAAGECRLCMMGCAAPPSLRVLQS